MTKKSKDTQYPVALPVATGVREVLKNLGTASLRQIREILGLTDKKGADRVYKAISDLKKSGEAANILHGLYRYQEPKNKYPTKQGKMWRAIRNSRRFNADDIVRLSGASRDYVLDYSKFLEGAGYIKNTGTKKDMQRVFQITPKATPGVPIYTQKKLPGKSNAWLEMERLLWELVRLVLKADTSLKQKTKLAGQELCRAIEQL